MMPERNSESKYYVFSVHHKYGEYSICEFKTESELIKYLWKTIKDNIIQEGDTLYINKETLDILIFELTERKYIRKIFDLSKPDKDIKKYIKKVIRILTNTISLKDIVDISRTIGQNDIRAQNGPGIVEIIHGTCL